LIATSFFLGILFSEFAYDYPVLWTRTPLESFAIDPFEALEAHLMVLHNSPPLIVRLLNTMIGVGLLGFFIKLWKPTEAQLLFDGASLALYMVGIIVYVANIIKGLRSIAAGEFYQPQLNAEPRLLGRHDGLRVLCASNTILALVLIGILVLQSGQWYAERKEGQEIEKLDQEKREKRSTTGSAKKRN
jgi:ER membrane protein SH3